MPLFFERDATGLPPGWMERVAHALARIPPAFDTDRMVAQFRDEAYLPLADAHGTLARDGHAELRAAVGRRAAVEARLQRVRVLGTRIEPSGGFETGDELAVQLDVDLGDLVPEDVYAELVLGVRNGDRELQALEKFELRPVRADGGTWRFVGVLRLRRSGSFAHAFPLRARTEGLAQASEDLVIWA